jgi:prepilin-type N-terminal cleavage/methylation domain-containing protein
MKANHKGFSLVEILIVIVVIGLLGAAGWFIYDRQNTNNTEQSNSQQGNQPQNSTANESEDAEKKPSTNWLLRQSSNATIHVPDGLEFLAAPGEDFDFVVPDQLQGTLVYKEGVLAKQIGEPHKHFDLGLIVGYNNEGFNDRGTKIKELSTYSGLSVDVKLYEQTTEPDGVDFPKGAKHLKYTVTKGSNYINIDYVYLGSGYVDAIEEMVKTATIN